MSVRSLLPRLRATRQRNSDTNGFIATLASFLKRRFSYSYCVKSKLTSQNALHSRFRAYRHGGKRSNNGERASCCSLPVSNSQLAAIYIESDQILRLEVLYRCSRPAKPPPSISGRVRARSIPIATRVFFPGR